MCGREGVVSFVSCLFRDGRATAAVMQVQQRGPGYECVCVRVCVRVLVCVCVRVQWWREEGIHILLLTPF